MNFEQAKTVRDRLEADSISKADLLKSISGGGPMGLTPDAVKQTVQWKAAYRNHWAAQDRLGRFNALMNKHFKKELAAERRARRA